MNILITKKKLLDERVATTTEVIRTQTELSKSYIYNIITFQYIKILSKKPVIMITYTNDNFYFKKVMQNVKEQIIINIKNPTSSKACRRKL